MSMLRLIQDQVLVKLDAQETMEHGLHISWGEQDQPTTGTVLGVGPGLRTRLGFKSTTLRKGDRVALSIRPGHDLAISGAPHVIAREFSAPSHFPNEGILAVIEVAA